MDDIEGTEARVDEGSRGRGGRRAVEQHRRRDLAPGGPRRGHHHRRVRLGRRLHPRRPSRPHRRIQRRIGGRSRSSAAAGQRGSVPSALEDRAVIYVGDLAEDDRYPRFAPAAADSGIRTVLAYPLVTDGLQGALNLYGRAPNAVGATDRGQGCDPGRVGRRCRRRCLTTTRGSSSQPRPTTGADLAWTDRPGSGHPHGARADQRRPSLRHPPPRLPTPQPEAARRRPVARGHRRITRHRQNQPTPADPPDDDQADSGWSSNGWRRPVGLARRS